MSGLFDASLPRSLYPTLPNVFTMSLRNKASKTGNTSSGATADGFTAAKTVSVRRRPATDEELARNNISTGERAIVHSVLDDGSDASFMVPLPEGKITDEAGTVWTIREVKHTILETLHSCVCVKDW